MAKLKLTLAQFLRLLVAGVFLIIVVVIAVNFITYSSRKPEAERLEEDTPPKNAEKMERGRMSEIKGGEGILDVEFDELFVDDDGLSHAVGHVRAFFKEKYELLADEIVYDQDWTNFLLKGKAQIRFEEAVLEGSNLTYDRNAEVFKTEKSASFMSERMTGSANELTYYINSERLELKNQVHLELTTELDTTTPLVVEGEEFLYSRTKRRGQMKNHVKFSQGNSFGSADFMEFTLLSEADHLQSVYFRGQVEGTLVEDGADGITRVVSAERVRVLVFSDSPQIETIKAEGACFFKFVFPSGNSQQGRSDSLKFILNPQGELREFLALGQAQLVDVDSETGEERIAAGDSLSIVESRKGLQIKGNEERKASLLSKNYQISANRILLDIEKNNLEANEDVNVILNPGEGKNAMGFFSQDKAIFITAERMRYSAEQDRFIFEGEIKSWQEKEVLFADELSVDQKTGEIACGGNVKSIFPYVLKNSQDQERVEISSERMTYDPEEQVILFSETCKLKAGEVEMAANAIKIDLNEGQEEMKKFLATGDVIIVQKQSEGRGQEAHFDGDLETIVLLGNPVLIDKTRGRIEGDKLTFFLTGDRIVVENQGQKRSISVIKS